MPVWNPLLGGVRHSLWSGRCRVRLSAFNSWYFERDPAWRGFYEFDALRAEFNVYGRGEYNEQTAPVFSSVGWTEVDVDLLKNWCFLDRKLYNTNTLRTLLDKLKSDQSSIEPRPWSELARQLLSDSELLGVWGCGVIFLVGWAHRARWASYLRAVM